jgi:hypothetical protein
VQRSFALAPVRRCQGAAAHLVAVPHDEPAHRRNFLRYVLVVSAGSRHGRSLRDCIKTYDNDRYRRSNVQHQNVIAAVARRLPHQTQPEVSEVVLPDIGRLRRVDGRFRPTPSLKKRAEAYPYDKA